MPLAINREGHFLYEGDGWDFGLLCDDNKGYFNPCLEAMSCTFKIEVHFRACLFYELYKAYSLS